MKRDSKLSGILHVLLHMSLSPEAVTSDTLAQLNQTHPVVIRRIMAGLRQRGYVQSEKGHGGGWRLSCDLRQVTLADIWRAVGEPGLIALGNRSESPGCKVEQAVNRALNDASQQAEALLLARLGEVSLAQLTQELHHPHFHSDCHPRSLPDE